MVNLFLSQPNHANYNNTTYHVTLLHAIVVDAGSINWVSSSTDAPLY
jgi:hypothetical protein